jgi:hypothetical protein
MLHIKFEEFSDHLTDSYMVVWTVPDFYTATEVQPEPLFDELSLAHVSLLGTVHQGLLILMLSCPVQIHYKNSWSNFIPKELILFKNKMRKLIMLQ